MYAEMYEPEVGIKLYKISIFFLLFVAEINPYSTFNFLIILHMQFI